MKIIVLADTHLRMNHKLTLLIPILTAADYVIHAGDFISKDVLDWFLRQPNFIGVHGNNDETEVKRLLPERTITIIGGFKIGICHESRNAPDQEDFKKTSPLHKSREQ
ncbi:Calcineurin-like phosphoesterase superfamily domain protein [Sporomusa ovata DSM 2662]|uniref:metallophosphoesterase family protein n=1 Tax=Sporomusa ovata TaxID=2378 RepID=UPI00038829DB|nr:metallophosphoesterase family protein [Sporomusa ovata]EQB25261.1 putative phosphoesterase [Sporomusa ovata DSM 2662]